MDEGASEDTGDRLPREASPSDGEEITPEGSLSVCNIEGPELGLDPIAEWERIEDRPAISVYAADRSDILYHLDYTLTFGTSRVGWRGPDVAPSAGSSWSEPLEIPEEAHFDSRQTATFSEVYSTLIAEDIDGQELFRASAGGLFILFESDGSISRTMSWDEMLGRGGFDGDTVREPGAPLDRTHDGIPYIITNPILE
jgi:hypothetical protein